MEIQGVDHVAFAVGDQSASIEWYRTVLGLCEEHPRVGAAPGDARCAAVAASRCSRRTALRRGRPAAIPSRRVSRRSRLVPGGATAARGPRDRVRGRRPWIRALDLLPRPGRRAARADDVRGWVWPSGLTQRRRPGRSVPSARESPRYRPRDGCVRVRDRPRKRRAHQGTGLRVLANRPAGAPGASAQDDLRRGHRSHSGACARRRRARGVLRGCRRPHRALRRAGARRRARRGRVGRHRVRRVRAGAGQAGHLRLRPRGQGTGAAHGEDDPLARHRAAHVARGRRARGRHLPCARCRRWRGSPRDRASSRPAGRSHARRARARRQRRRLPPRRDALGAASRRGPAASSPWRRTSTCGRTRCSSTGSRTPTSESCSRTC